MQSVAIQQEENASGTVLFEIELPPKFPQQVALVLKGNNGLQEKVMTFSRKVRDRDFFGVTTRIEEGQRYAFQVKADTGCHWITPKGNEHGQDPHNWFPCTPQPYNSEASKECGPDRVKVVGLPATQADSAFKTPEWVRDAVFYQIFPERFSRGAWSQDPDQMQGWGSTPALDNFMGGNIQGIIDRLGYLSDLGVTAVYLGPIFSSPSNHKYDTIDYFQVDPCFGSAALMHKLVKCCHDRGLRIILDGVFNHCSDQHPFFLDVKKQGQQSPYWNWFHVRRWPIPDTFSNENPASNWYDCWWGHHTLPKFNHNLPEVEQYFLAVATYWLTEFGVDGWRLDVPNEVLNSFWPKFRQAVKAVNPESYIVGEIWDDPVSWLQGDRFDGVMNYQFQRAMLSYISDEEIDTSTFDLTLWRSLGSVPAEASFAMLNLIGSHDTKRVASYIGASDGIERRLQKLKLMAALQFWYPGAPCIYYGDEIGLEGEKDPDCRRCYPWGWNDHGDAQDWREELFNYYKKLIELRKANPALRRGYFKTIEAGHQRELYVFERCWHKSRCMVAINRGAQDQILDFPKNVRVVDLLAASKVKDESAIVPARQARVYKLLDKKRLSLPSIRGRAPGSISTSDMVPPSWACSHSA